MIDVISYKYFNLLVIMVLDRTVNIMARLSQRDRPDNTLPCGPIDNFGPLMLNQDQ